jgi:hypothetical protein
MAAKAAAEDEDGHIAWMPWEDEQTAGATKSSKDTKAVFWSPHSDDDEPPPPEQQQHKAAVSGGGIPAKVAALKAKEAAEDLQQKMKEQLADDDEEVDPLDAFMSAEVGVRMSGNQGGTAVASCPSSLPSVADFWPAQLLMARQTHSRSRQSSSGPRSQQQQQCKHCKSGLVWFYSHPTRTTASSCVEGNSVLKWMFACRCSCKWGVCCWPFTATAVAAAR